MTTATRSTALPAWVTAFKTPEEVNRPVTDVEGRLPDGLAGTLYRVGPAKLDLAHHLFDGDGMVSAVRFGADGGIHCATRFVRTRKFLAELGASSPAVKGFGTLPPGGPLRNALRLSPAAGNAANTSLMFTAGRLLALWEAGHPWQLDPSTLETIGEMDFDGALETRTPFSAHPHWDPGTGEIFNFGMAYGRKNTLATYRIDRSGALHPLAEIGVPAPVMNHDFIVTDRWLVFCLNPVRLRLLPFLTGRAAFGDALEYREKDATTIVLVPRDGGPPVYIEAPAWFQFHFAAAYDDGDDVVIDLSRYQSYDDIQPYLKEFRTAATFGRAPTLWRYRVSTTARRAEARELATGKTDAWDPGRGWLVSEPIFVPRPGGTAEDDGWLVALGYDPDRQATDAVVLDARDLAAGPVFTAHLPVSTGVTFHGAWRRPA